MEEQSVVAQAVKEQEKKAKAKAYNNAWRKANPEKYREYMRKYMKKKKLKAQKQKRFDKKEYMIKWRKTHKKEVSDYGKKYWREKTGDCVVANLQGIVRCRFDDSFIVNASKLSADERKLILNETATLYCPKCERKVDFCDNVTTDSGHVWLEEYGVWCKKDQVDQFKKDYERYCNESK